MPTTPKEVVELVKKFELNIDSYRNPAYNEAQVRQEFINPLFEILGWDMANRQGFAEAYKEVIHEATVKIGVATKAPDYAFRIGGTKKFFLEAKKPGVDLKNNPEPAYQLRRYAWSAGLPLSILTDFEEFAVYDCRIRPQKSDKASAARILFLTYREYETRWGEIAGIFDKQSIQQGSFDRYAEGAKGKRGTSPVDDAFLKEIEEWRSELAHDLARRNSRLKVRDLNFAVQRTIDRIIFLRMCEDRGIEPYGQLQALLNGVNVYARLKQIYDLADDKYNSGLFHFQPEKDRAEPPDELTTKLKIDDKVLKDIIGRLYYPESPYEFSVLSGDILGNVYEQFLGKVIHLTKTHQARIEEKPEVKKAGGVYYTPKYIVDYIVKNTVGKLCEGKTPKQLEKLKILDPACGSGSFLIGAYNYLLDYHREWYVKNSVEGEPNPQPLPETGRGEKQPPASTLKSRGVPLRKGDRNEIYQGSGGEWYLTTQKKKEILLNNIYGVDIDGQAVEVTKLNLLLKVLENETKDTLESQMKLWRHRALPDLGNNIKCGNSLIGPDYYHGKQQTLFDEEEKIKVNAFDWKSEFPEIMKQGGFDTVVGNPPYSAKLSLETKKITSFFESVEYKSDPYAFFLEQGWRKLKTGGKLGFIVPVTWMTNFYYRKLRELFIKSRSLRKIVLIDGLVFKGANVDTCLLFLDKAAINSKTFEWSYVKPEKLDSPFTLRRYESVEREERYDISPEVDEDWLTIKSKVDSVSVKLDSLSKISLGMKLRSNQEFVSIKRDKNHPDPIFFGKDISRYGFLEPSRFFNFKKAVIVGGTKKPEVHRAKSKILIQAIRNLSLERRIVATMDFDGTCFIGTLNGLKLEAPNYNIHYLLGLINSNLLNIYFRKRFTTISLTASFLGVLPIRTIDFSKSKDKESHEKTAGFVEKMMELNRQLYEAKSPDDKTRLQRQIDATDRQIDQLVYELYGLTEEEIAVVEGKAT